MKTIVGLVAVVLVVLLYAMNSCCANEAELDTVSGVVKVTESNDGKIVTATLVDEDGELVCNIKINRKNAAYVQKHKDQAVVITGKIVDDEEDEYISWIEVADITLMPVDDDMPAVEEEE